MTVGERIRELREKHQITQSELARRLNTTKQTIYKYENNIITNIPPDKIEKLASTLHSTPQYIMGWIKNTDTEEKIIDYYDDTLSEILNFLETNGYQITEGLLDFIHLYDENNNFIGGIEGYVLVRNYEKLKYEQSQITIDRLLQSLLLEYSLICKYHSVDEKGKHTIETIADMEYNRYKKEDSSTK